FQACQGAFSVVIATGDMLIAARDRHGLRPLSLGRTETGALVVASETCALDIVGARFERDLQPGEVLIAQLDEYYAGLQQRGLGQTESVYLTGEPRKERLCIFELVYFARPDSLIRD